MTNETNLWRSLPFYDPAAILRRLRTLEHELADVDMDERVRRLRTPGLKTYREARDGALFVYGIGLGKQLPMEYTPFEHADYDFVARWRDGTTEHYIPVQLKELPPSDLNPKLSIESLLTGIRSDVPRTSTVLAIKLNRSGQTDLTKLSIPKLPYRQLWFFFATQPGSNAWRIFGDALGTPGYFSYAYPEPDAHAA
jgi:hypothetical protein